MTSRTAPIAPLKVLLVSANTLTSPYPVYPLGLDYVAGAMNPMHEVRILDLNHRGLGNGLRTDVRDLDPDVAGIAIRNVDTTDAVDPRGFLDQYRQVVAAVRASCRAKIVLGGSGFTLFPNEMMAALAPDYGVMGEGERFAALVDALAGNGDPTFIPGVVAGRAPSAFPEPLADSPIRRFDPDAPHVAFYLKKGGMLNLQTQRGCPFRCIYCTYPLIEGRRPRPMAPDQAGITARRLQDAGAKFIFITDSVFNGHADHSLAVARAFRENGVSIPWGAFFSPLKPPDGYYDTMAAAGLTHVEFGTDSLSDRVLPVYRKSFTVADVMAAHDAANRAGLKVAHYLLLGGSGEDAESIEETLGNIDKLSRTVLFFFCGMRIYPRTRLHEIAVAEGQISADDDLTTPVYYQSPAAGKDFIIERVHRAAAGRINWIIGSGGDRVSETLSRMYARGKTGPLWEYLIR